MGTMTTRVVSLTAEEVVPGMSVTVDGRAHLVLFLLPRRRGWPLAARVTHEPPCWLCEAPLVWHPGGWTCSCCHDTPSADALAAWAAEHVADGTRAGRARRETARRQRRADRWRAQLGIPAAAMPTDSDFHAAANAGAWRRAELLARIALYDGHRLTAAARDAWRERRDRARLGAARGE